MDTSTSTFCRFSPLKTPKTKQKKLLKFAQQDRDVSDTESLASVVTSDIHKLAKSVTNKLKSKEDVGMMSSDDDLFISQSKKDSSPVKSAKKRPISDSESDSSVKNSSSESETETKNSPTRKNQKKLVSPKKRLRYESEETKSEKKLKSTLTSPQKSRKKNTLHDISESSDDSSSSETDSSKRSSVIAPVSSKRRKGSSSSENSRSSVETRNSSRSVSGSDDESDSGTDRSSDSDKSESILQSKTVKTTPTKNKTVADEASFSENGKLRYEIPENFEIGTSVNYLSKSDIKGKKLWLITAPDDFDISVLHGQKINLAGTSFISNEDLKTDKQFEVVGRPFTSKMPNYSSASSHAPESEDFVLGSQLSGQLQVMDWIPCMPKIELVIPHHEKHRVPDNLKPTFVPFGSESPDRDVETDCLVDQKEKHKKKKKKKDKKKK